MTDNKQKYTPNFTIDLICCFVNNKVIKNWGVMINQVQEIYFKPSAIKVFNLETQEKLIETKGSTRSSQRRLRNQVITQKNILSLDKTPAQKFAEILEYARKNLPPKGRLVSNPDGYGYIDLDDDYIYKLFSMLEMEGFEMPPYFRREDSAGAHITVFLVGEHIFPEIEMGKEFQFEIKKIEIIQVPGKPAFIVIEVESKELEALREKYGLSPKVHGTHEFHITIAQGKVR